MRPSRPELLAGLFLALVFCIEQSGSAYVPSRFGTGGVHLLRDPGTFPLTYQTNEKTINGTLNLSGGGALNAFRAALAEWQSVPTANIKFNEIQTTTVESASSADGINLITMADTPANAALFGGPLVGALTLSSFDILTGKITDTDIVFNPKVNYSTNFAGRTIDLQAVATHEVGHSLGCDHSSALNDTMFWNTREGEFFQRYLSPDSIAFATATYPNTSRVDLVGAISGRVTQSGTGVFGAAVTAMELDRNLIYTAITEPDGSYKITGPVLGRYTLWVEPLDGPAATSNISDSFYRNLKANFRTVILENQDFRTPDGGTRGPRKSDVNFTLSNEVATLNINLMGRGQIGTTSVVAQSGSAVASPGESINLFIGGPETSRLESMDDITILGSGITIDRSRPILKFRDGSGADIGFAIAIRVGADAAPGPRTILLRVGDQRVASTGGIVVTGRTPPVRRLYLPFLTKSSEQYTGLAIANASSSPAVVRVSARDSRGELVYEEDSIVPADLTVGSRAQIARLDSQIFNLPASSRVAGSITIESDSSDLQGFFLTGDFASQYLDGGEAFTRAFKKLYFTDVIQNSVTSTEIHLMNVRDSAITVQMALMNSLGVSLRSLTRSIPPRGKIEGTVSALFSFRDDVGSGYITASAGEDALVGFELIRQPSTVFGFNAQPEDRAAATLYSAQLAAGDFGVHFSTRLNIVNIGSTQATLTLSILSDSGQVLATPPSPTVVLPGGQLTLDAMTFFSLAGATQGSVKVLGSPGARLIGNVLFGDGDPHMKSLSFGAALPLAATGSTNFLFSQLAQGQAYYTGLAFLALDDTTVSVQVYKPDGTSMGLAALDLRAGTRQVHLLYELFPTLREQLGGYVKVTSTKPVIGFELFGSTSGLFLSAVAPQSLEPN